MFNTEQEKFQYLVQNGWKPDSAMWTNPILNNNSSYTLYAAMEIQVQNDKIDKNGAFYKVFANKFGYGFDVRFRKSKKSLLFNGWTKLNRPTKEGAEEFADSFNKIPRNQVLSSFSINLFSYRKILIVDETPNKRYFYVPTFNTFCNAALKIILERDKLGQGYWYEFNTKRPIAPEVNRNKIQEILLQKDRFEMTRQWNKFDLELKEYYRQLKLRNLFKKILKEKDPIDAALFLDERRYETFEGYELVEAESSSSESK